MDQTPRAKKFLPINILKTGDSVDEKEYQRFWN
jgi:hypothetical protein